VIEVLGGVRDVDLDPLDGAGEPAALRGVVVADRRGRVGADVAVSSAEKTIGTVASTRPSPVFAPSR
jgi:hypothetical protein